MREVGRLLMIRRKDSTMRSLGILVLILAYQDTVYCYCQNGWIRFDNSCYLIEDLKKMNWTQAGNYCISQDSHLIVIESKQENDFIKHELSKLHPGAEDQFWTAGNDLDAEANWVWGQTTDFVELTFWHPGEPNQANGEEDCLTYYTRFRFEWNDEHCNKNMNFICELEDYVGIGVVG